MANATRGNVITDHYITQLHLHFFVLINYMYSTGIEKEIGALQLEVCVLIYYYNWITIYVYPIV